VKRVLIALIAIVLTIGMARPALAQTGKKITVGLLPKAKGNPYFSSCNEGAQAAAKELGNVEVLYDGPTDGSPEKAAALIDQWILKKVDVIAVSPNDPEVLAPAMQKARSRGIHVITWDADGKAGTREFFVNQATAQAIGAGLVDTMANDLGGRDAKGDVAIVTATMTAANQNEWIKHMKVQLAKYPGLNLVATKPSDDKAPVAFQATQDLMKAYPNLKGVFAITSVAFPAAADAIQQSGNSGKVLVTGLATPNSMKPHVKDGTVKSVFLWNTQDLGYLVVYTARALADGTLKPGATTIKAGHLGERKVDGESVLLGDYLVFTKDNIDKFDF
jgi:rhamnose ABC transporter rhamnose-binding protein